jgi:hypothetical protein
MSTKMNSGFKKCCNRIPQVIQWTCKGPLQYGAECAICGNRLAGENVGDLQIAWNKRRTVQIKYETE